MREKNVFGGKDELDPEKQFAFKEYLQSLLPQRCLKCCCRCIRPSKKDQLFEEARERLQKELDLVGILKQLRFFQIAFRSVLSPKAILLLKEKSEKLLLDVDDEDGEAGEERFLLGDLTQE